MRALWRRIFHPYWWTLGWSSKTSSPRRNHVFWSLCFSNFTRPIVRWDLRDPDGRFITFELGNSYGDPGVSIGVEWYPRGSELRGLVHTERMTMPNPDRDSMPPVTGIDLTDPEQLEEADAVKLADTAEDLEDEVLEDEESDEGGAADNT